ncbi:hypothetical protein EAE99_011131 [Botrytis elliptica]|nr:hypothetical protein EAE99_011131 [Botrytis elliptica]
MERTRIYDFEANSLPLRTQLVSKRVGSKNQVHVERFSSLRMATHIGTKQSSTMPTSIQTYIFISTKDRIGEAAPTSISRDWERNGFNDVGAM